MNVQTLNNILLPYIKSNNQFILKNGQLNIVENDVLLFSLGEKSDLVFTVSIESIDTLSKILEDPELNLGNTYANEQWNLTHGDLADFLGWLASNNKELIKKSPSPKLLENSIENSKNYISYHYDLGNDLYECFLDSGMNYSCAFFDDHRMSLHQAQLNKIYTTLHRAKIDSGMNVLDIGCGWGNLCFILSTFADDINVTGITLSENQISWVNSKKKIFSTNKMKFLLSDYRSHAISYADQYDRIISIGMFEHVGKDHMEEFFKSIYQLLKPGCHAIIHSIMRPDPGNGTSRWLDSHIFPGGNIPYLPDVLKAARKQGLIIPREPFLHKGLNYAQTLRRWRDNFQKNRDSLDPKKYDRRFLREWDFYLASSQAAFEGLNYFVAQMIFQKQ